MSSNVVNQMPYLRTTREFPTDLERLVVEVDKAYLDTAKNVNERIIGLFPTSKPAITGSSYYINSNQRQQSFRRVYRFTSSASINHGITTSTIYGFVDGYGSYTDGTNFYGLPFMTNTAIAGQITFYVTSTQIVFSVGAGAPAITSGIVILEWLSFP